MKHSKLARTVAGLATVAVALMSGTAIAQDVNLTFWGSYGNGGNSAQQDALNEILIPAFEAENPGISVDYVDVPYDSLLQKLTTSAAGDALPDLIRADLGWVPQFADLGVLAPLSELMPDYQTLADATYPGSLSTNLLDGKYYGLPLDTNTRVLVTSQAALDAAELDAPPATFEELLTMAEALEGTGIDIFADSGLGSWNVFPWIWSGGGNITDANLTVASGHLDGPKSVAAVEMLVDLYQDGKIPNLIIGNQGATGTSDGLPTGKYATILDGPWMAGIWGGQYPEFTPIYAPVPTGDGGSISVVGGQDIVLTNSSENKEAAMEFIRFTQTEMFQMEMAKSGNMTVIPEFADQQAELAPYYVVFSDQLETARSRLAIPQSSQVDGILSSELTPAFEGKVSVQTALTNAAGQIDQLLARN